MSTPPPPPAANLSPIAGHFFGMGFYSTMHTLVGPQLRKKLPSMSKEERYRTSRLLDAWEYGSGSDYRYQGPEEP